MKILLKIVQQIRFKRLMSMIKGALDRCNHLVANYKIISGQGLIRLLLSIGIITFLIISLVFVFNSAPDTVAAFPYIPPPEGDAGYYIEATTDKLTLALMAAYSVITPDTYKGKDFIFKDVLIKESRLRDTYLMISVVLFQPQDPSDLNELKAGDMVDIIGVCDGALEEGSTIVVVKNCRFLPAGVVNLPLPGGPALISGGY